MANHLRDGCAFVDEVTKGCPLVCFMKDTFRRFQSKSEFTAHIRSQLLSAGGVAELFKAGDEFKERYDTFDVEKKRALVEKLMELVEEPRFSYSYSQRRKTEETGVAGARIFCTYYCFLPSLSSDVFIYKLPPSTYFVIRLFEMTPSLMKVVYYKEQGVRASALEALVRDQSSGHWDIGALFAVRGSALNEMITLMNDAMDFVLDETFLDRMPIVLGVCFENLQKLDHQAIENDHIRHMHAYGRMLGVDVCNVYSLSESVASLIPHMGPEEELLDVCINWDDNQRRVSELEGTKTRYRLLEEHHPYERYGDDWIRISEPPAFYKANKKPSDGEPVPVSIRLWSYWRESIEGCRLCVEISVKRMD